MGKTVYDIAPPDLATRYDAADRALLANPGVQTYEASVVYADGTRHNVIFHKATFSGIDGTIAGQIGVLLDITERKLAEDKIKYLAFYDHLTGLPNRRLFNDRLQQAMAASKRNGLYGALMFLDLDNFKPLNDLHGHGVGDLLLIEAARRLKASVREMDTVARFGGDEFVVMLAELGTSAEDSAAQTNRVGEKIRAALSEPYHLTLKGEEKGRHIDRPSLHGEHRCRPLPRPRKQWRRHPQTRRQRDVPGQDRRPQSHRRARLRAATRRRHRRHEWQDLTPVVTARRPPPALPQGYPCLRRERHPESSAAASGAARCRSYRS